MTGESEPLTSLDRELRQKPPLRLRKRPDFLKAAGGRKIHAALVSIHVAPQEGDAPTDTRVGFTVTKKVGRAVERNRIRRRLKDIVRTVPDLCMKPSHDYVIVARRDVLTASHAAIVAGLQAAIRRAHGAPGRGRGSVSKGRSEGATTS